MTMYKHDYHWFLVNGDLYAYDVILWMIAFKYNYQLHAMKIWDGVWQLQIDSVS